MVCFILCVLHTCCCCFAAGFLLLVTGVYSRSCSATRLPPSRRLYEQYERVSSTKYVRIESKGCYGKHLQAELSGRWLGLHKRYLERPTAVDSPLATEKTHFIGMLEAISMRHKVSDGHPPGFMVDPRAELVYGLQCKSDDGSLRP
jgi:hypothetical protein